MRSYPQLSLRGRPTVRTIRPSARTATSPRTCSRIIPKAQTPIPPAFVATIPPTVAESRAARSTPKCSPAARACAASAAAVTPAPTTTVRSTTSTGSIRAQRGGQQEQGRPIGHRAADQTGVAALDLHGDARRPGRRQHDGDLLGRARADRPQSGTAPPPRPVDAVAGQEVGVGRHRDPGRVQGVAQCHAAGRPAARVRSPSWAPSGPCVGRVVRRVVGRGHGDILPSSAARSRGRRRPHGVARPVARPHGTRPVAGARGAGAAPLR